MMTILLVTPWSLSEVNGVSLVVKMVAFELRRKGHQVLVLTLNGERHPLNVETIEGVSVYSAYLRGPYVDNAPLRGVISFFVHLPGTLYQLYRFLSRNKVEIVGIQFPLGNGFYFAVLRWISSWKLVVTFHGSDANELSSWMRIERYLVKRLLFNADCITAVSKSLYTTLIELFPSLKNKRYCIVPNGAPLDLIDQAPLLNGLTDLPARYVFSAGNLIYRKGFDVLIRAIRLARDHGVEVNVVIAGDGPEREALGKLADEVGVSANVRFVGARSHEGVLGLMKSSQLFVLASRAEGMALVIPEAMGCGKAVIATNVNGASEIVRDGITGILVSPDDPESLAQALIKVCTDLVFCEKLAINGLECARKEYSWEAIAGRYLKLFVEL